MFVYKFKVGRQPILLAYRFDATAKANVIEAWAVRPAQECLPGPAALP